jgi:hypothetical protein
MALSAAFGSPEFNSSMVQSASMALSDLSQGTHELQSGPQVRLALGGRPPGIFRSRKSTTQALVV